MPKMRNIIYEPPAKGAFFLLKNIKINHLHQTISELNLSKNQNVQPNQINEPSY